MRLFASIYTSQLSNGAGYAYGGTLPESSLTVIIGTIISGVLGLLGVVFLLLTLYSGLLWMTAGGNPDQVKKAKQIIFNSVVGLTIVLSSYAITATVIRYLSSHNIY